MVVEHFAQSVVEQKAVVVDTQLLDATSTPKDAVWKSTSWQVIPPTPVAPQSFVPILPLATKSWSVSW